MNPVKEFERALQQEFRDLLPNTIFKDDTGPLNYSHPWYSPHCGNNGFINLYFIK